MKSTKLYLIEKLYLYIRGRSDANNEAFQYNETKFAFDNEAGNGKNGQAAVVISSFIMTELCSFNAKRDAMLSRSLCIPKISEKNSLLIMRFSKAIARIDKMIAKLEGKRNGLIRVYEEKKTQLEGLVEDSKSNSAKHMEKLYEKRIMALNETHNCNLVENNTKIVELYNEKIRLIEVLKVKLIAIRSRKFLRIQYYYAKARTVATRLPIGVLGEKELIQIGRCYALGRYENMLRKTYEARDKMLEGKPQEGETQESVLQEGKLQEGEIQEGTSQES